MSVVFRKEVLLTPYISTNGYGIGYTSAKKRSVDKYFYWKINFSEIKHRKEIKGVNPRYPNQSEFIFGKINHVYPLSLSAGYHQKIVLKHNKKAIGIRYFYGAGVEIGILKPVFYQIELVYSQDSSRVFTDQFDPEHHNVNNIRERASWFKGFDHLGITPGVSAEAGFMVDFSRKPGRIQGVSLSANLKSFILPAETLAGESGRRFYLGFNLAYVWGKILNFKKYRNEAQQHKGWGMLKNY